MLTLLRFLIIALASSSLAFNVLDDDCRSDVSPVCLPCNCNAAGACAGFCHHHAGSTGPKYCSAQAQGCTCPPGFKNGPSGRAGGRVRPV
ncbi:hypothetical protein Cob_v002882 [Colletotrichum orbiculare MAFF 240422]|uniref:Uncharacterized protein n=1 Tax=Colletotrichum orbiculare (strain 104-T / ATCC 96160 / CBS 514.97 / LARS 414 / MAFF 240422) TaxID=1213857 RepID=A0A484G3G2_COLOR|nr:hypothetical protein Cob_v002882 [Colletotrichum orbiculare MAFF 240422]